MLVRVRSKDGIFRFPLEPADDAALLVDKVLATTINADPSSLTFSNQPRGGEFQANDLRGTTLGELGISHGHLLYAAYRQASSSVSTSDNASNVPASATSQPSEATAVAGPSTTPTTASGASTLANRPKKPWEEAVEHQVDTYWEAQDCKIPRSKDAQFCRHGPKGMCDYCMPLEPYDSGYQAEHSIKHLSFHAYLRKQDIAFNKPSQSYIPPLEEVDYRVKTPCPSGQHPGWPAGICTKCQPSAITLQRQPYRMVDHVEFAHPDLIERILAFWRSTASQRFGFLLGRYEAYPDVPMGIKAVVEAIHEPAQEGELDGLTLGVPWDDQPRVENLARSCGLEFVGMIYSDLSPADPTHQDPTKAGMVACKRHKDSFFLSGCETLFAAQLQLGNPNPSRFSSSGRFNSKFVTCVLSGTEEGAIDVSAYQVSEQAMGMVQANMIEASVNPNIIRVKPSGEQLYVPEVFYRYTNEYKIDVKESAKPTFPVEYLIVNVTHGFPNAPNPTFLSSAFPIENRPGLHDQDLTVALTDIGKVVGHRELLPVGGGTEDTKGKSRADDNQVREKLVGTLSDWHLLAFLDTSGLLDKDDMAALCRMATTHDSGAALDALLLQPGWQTLAAIAREHAPAFTSNNNHHSSSASSSNNNSSNINNATNDVRTESADTGKSEPAGNDFTYDGGESDDEMAFEDADDAFVDEDNDNDDDDDDDDNDFQITGVSTHGTSSMWPGGTAGGEGLIEEVGGGSGGEGGGGQVAPSDAKVCPHCTFHNALGAVDCDVCGLPL